MDHVKTARDDGVLAVTLDRADRRNSITAAMYSDIVRIPAAAGIDGSTRAPAMQGRKEVFTAGDGIGGFQEKRKPECSAR